MLIVLQLAACRKAELPISQEQAGMPAAVKALIGNASPLQISAQEGALFSGETESRSPENESATCKYRFTALHPCGEPVWTNYVIVRWSENGYARWLMFWQNQTYLFVVNLGWVVFPGSTYTLEMVPSTVVFYEISAESLEITGNECLNGSYCPVFAGPCAEKAVTGNYWLPNWCDGKEE